MENWHAIPSFSGYSVSDNGRVRSDHTGRIITLVLNNRGIVMVGLYKNGLQYKRSVSVLVIETFMEKPTLDAFDTPINLDGDRTNNCIDNLTWRPRWFAIKYFQQFRRPPEGFAKPIIETKTGEYFKTSWEAATKYGLLDREILLAVLNRTYVWPTFQIFRVVG